MNRKIENFRNYPMFRDGDNFCFLSSDVMFELALNYNH